MVTPRSWRNMAATATLLVGVLAAPAVAHAGPAPAGRVLATDVEATPAGTLRTTTVGLGGATAGTRGTDRGLAPGWTTIASVPPGTQQVGLTWSGEPQAQFEVRARASAERPWAPAQPLEGQVDEGPDAAAGRPGAGPLWLGEAGVTEVQVHLLYGIVSDVRLDAMGWTAKPATTRTTGTRAQPVTIARPATPAGGPPIRLRSSWAPGGWVPGADPSCAHGPIVNPTLEHAVVHHTETPNGYSQAAVPGILAGIYRFHTQSRGWCDIAYNFFVDRFGGVWEGRSGGIDQAAQGGHAMGFNKQSVGVALIGQHQTGGSFAVAAPTAVELTALRDLLAWKLGSQGIDPRSTPSVTSGGNARYAAGTVVALPAIGGHGDNGYTSCPGDLVRPRLAQLRIDVASRIAVTNDAARWRPQDTGAGYFRQLFTDAEGRVAAPSQIGTFTSLVVRAGYPQGALAGAEVLSAKTDGRVGLVDRLYRSAFGRLPDTAGLTANVAHRDRGMVARDLAGNFLASSEFTRTYGTPDDRAFTALLYRNALGREPSTADLDRWSARLAGGLARRDMLLQFSESPEARSRLSAATRVTTGFFVMLRRVPSAASRAYWEPRLQAGTTNEAFVVNLLRTPEYAARF
ncbi:hypothetical protein BH10ACT1_BH10ACT1_41340 [soil metagenome]